MAEHETQAYIGHGTLFQRGNGDGPPETFTTISEVQALEPPDDEADEHETSHMESPGGKKEFISGMTDPGELSFTIAWNPDAWPTHAQLRADKASGETRSWRFILPDNRETLTLKGFVKSLKRNIEPNAPVTADVTIRVTGDTTVS